MLLTIAIFITIWFVTIYPLLNIGAVRDDAPVPGQPLSAPKAPNLRWKMVANTAIAVLLTAAIVWWHRHGAPL